MALNLEQLIDRFLKIRYPIAPECTCRIEINTIKALREGRKKRLREEMKGLPHEVKMELVNKMIEKENATCEESRTA